MKKLLKATRAELMIKNSRFVAEAFPVTSPEAARELWRTQRARYDNGNHVVYAFITGPQGNVMGCSDDGEPAGTAGRPTLAVLKGSGLTGCIITTARWFGGIKLGTGGLVRAYSDCAKAALAKAEIAELVPEAEVEIELHYNCYESAKLLFAAAGFSAAEENFAQHITLKGTLPAAAVDRLRNSLQELTSNPDALRVVLTPESESPELP